MPTQDINKLKQAFSDGKEPDGQDFANLIDSYMHKSTKLPQSQIMLTNSEDIQINEDHLLFADKVYEPDKASGLGRVYLRKNIQSGVNVLTKEMITSPNTIYHIQYDYDLQGATITIPEGSTLQFEGGSFKNGYIVLKSRCKVYNGVFYDLNNNDGDGRPVISANGATSVLIDGCECYANLDPNQIKVTSSDYFIRLENCSNCSISKCNIYAKSYGVGLKGCNGCNVENISLTGVLSDLVSFGVVKLNANYHYAVIVLDGELNNIVSCRASNAGGCVVAGGDTKRLNVSNCLAKNVWANGIYISSGKGVVVSNVVVVDSRGSGIKTRGSNNNISSCSVKNCFVGFSSTGNGHAIKDGYLAQFETNGYGNIISNCVAEDCQAHGILIGITEVKTTEEEITEYYEPYGTLVQGCTVFNCGILENYHPVRILGSGHRVVDNIIQQSPSNQAIACNNTNKQYKYVEIVHNTIIGCFGGVILPDVFGFNVSYNRFFNLVEKKNDKGLDLKPKGIEIKKASNSFFIDNYFDRDDYGLSKERSEESINNVFVARTGLMGISGYERTKNRVSYTGCGQDTIEYKEQSDNIYSIRITDTNKLMAFKQETDGKLVYVRDKGSTAQRPTLSMNFEQEGFQYFDTTLKRPIYWNGSNWVDSVGNTI